MTGLAVRRRWARRAVLAFVSGFLLLFVLPPLLIPLLTSFKTASDVFALPVKLLPAPFTFESYVNAVIQKGFHRPLLNSFVVASIVTMLTLIVALPAAYGLARFRFRGRRIMTIAVLLAYLVPSVALLVPLFVTFRWLGLTGTLGALVLSHLLFTVPFAIWFLRGFFAYVPWELEDAAMIDGCRRFEALYMVLLPILAPGVLAIGFFSFISSWGEFIYSLIFAGTRTSTAPVAMAQFVSEAYVDWGGLAASSVMFSLPVALLFMFFQKYLITGMSSGSVKG